MAALVVLNSDLSKLTKTAIKKEIREKLSTIEEYKIQIENAIDKFENSIKNEKKAMKLN